MGRDKDEIAFESDKAQAIEILKMIQEEVDYKYVLLTQQALKRVATRKIPFLERFLDVASSSGDKIVKIGTNSNRIHGNPADNSIGQGFQFGGVALSALDFLRIPIIYFSAYMSNQKVPMNLNNNAQWLYSAVLLGLTITSLAVPPIAPIIAFISAGIVLGAACFGLGKTLHQRYQLSRERKKLKGVIESEEEGMLLIQDKANELEGQLTNATEKSHVIAIYQEIAVLQESYHSQKKQLGHLKSDYAHVEQKIKKLGMIHVLDKSVGVILSTLSVIGLVVSLFLPPVGLAILFGVAVASGSYLIARLTTPVFKAVGNWISNIFKPSSGNNATGEGLVNENSLGLKDSKQVDLSAQVRSPEHGSTAMVLEELLGREGAMDLMLKRRAGIVENNTDPEESSLLIGPAQLTKVQLVNGTEEIEKQTPSPSQ